MSTPTTSPTGAIAAAAAAAAASSNAGGDGGCADELGETVPMLCFYYDADEALSDQKIHSCYLSADSCPNHRVSPCIHSLHNCN